jgi:hypothetical protein
MVDRRGGESFTASMLLLPRLTVFWEIGRWKNGRSCGLLDVVAVVEEELKEAVEIKGGLRAIRPRNKAEPALSGFAP